MKLSHNNGKLTYFPHFFCKTSLIPSAILASMFVSSIPLHSCGLWHIPPYFRWWLPRSQVLQVTWYIPPILCQIQICLWFDRFNPKVLQVKLSQMSCLTCDLFCWNPYSWWNPSIFVHETAHFGWNPNFFSWWTPQRFRTLLRKRRRPLPVWPCECWPPKALTMASNPWDYLVVLS